MPLHVSSTCAHHQEVKIALHSLWYHHTYRCFTISFFHASTCFEHMCSSSGGQNCITQPLVSSHLRCDDKFFSCLYMFRAHVLIIRRSKLHYTASGIITPKVWWYQRLCNAILTSWWWAHVFETCRGMKETYCKTNILCIKLVNYWDKYAEMHGQQNVKIWRKYFVRCRIWKLLRFFVFGDRKIRRVKFPLGFRNLHFEIWRVLVGHRRRGNGAPWPEKWRSAQLGIHNSRSPP